MPPKKGAIRSNSISYSCTACTKAIVSASDAKLHPLIGCLVCRKCSYTYADGDFGLLWGDGLDEFGDDNYCRWCCDGGELFGCMNQQEEDERCHFAFCKDCIERNVPDDIILTLEQLEDEDKKEINWNCYACDPSKLKLLNKNARAAIKELNGKGFKKHVEAFSPQLKRRKTEVNHSTTVEKALASPAPALASPKPAPAPPAPASAPASPKPAPAPPAPASAPPAPASAPVPPKAAPVPPKAAPVPPKAAPVPPKAAPIPPKPAPAPPKPALALQATTPAPTVPTLAPPAPTPAPPAPALAPPKPALPSPLSALLPAKAADKPSGLPVSNLLATKVSQPKSLKQNFPVGAFITPLKNIPPKPNNNSPVNNATNDTPNNSILSQKEIEELNKTICIGASLSENDLKQRLHVYRQTKEYCIKEIGSKFETIVDLFKLTKSNKGPQTKKLISIQIDSLRKPILEFESMLSDLKQQAINCD